MISRKQIICLVLPFLLSLQFLTQGAYAQKTNNLMVQNFKEVQIKYEAIAQWTIKNQVSTVKKPKIECAKKNTNEITEVFGLTYNFSQTTKISQKIKTLVQPTQCYAKFQVYLQNISYGDVFRFNVDGKKILEFQCHDIDINLTQRYDCKDPLYPTTNQVTMVPKQTDYFPLTSKSFEIDFEVQFAQQNSYWGIHSFELYCDYKNTCANNNCLCSQNEYESLINPLVCLPFPACDPSCNECAIHSTQCTRCPINSKLSDDKTECKCAEYSVLSTDGYQCICRENSFYNFQNNTCQCNSNTVETDNKCAVSNCDKSCNGCDGKYCAQCFFNSMPSQDRLTCPCKEYQILQFYDDKFQCKCIGNTILSSQNNDCYCPQNSSFNTDQGLCICHTGYYPTLNNDKLLCVQVSCNSSCLECMVNSNICIRCPDFAIYTDNYTSCTCPNNSEINEVTGNCECIMSDAYFRPYGTGCDCLDDLILVPRNGIIKCEVPVPCDSSCKQCECNTKICQICPDYGILVSEGTQCVCPQYASLSEDGWSCDCPEFSKYNDDETICVCEPFREYNPLSKKCQCISGYLEVTNQSTGLRECVPKKVCNASCLQCSQSTGCTCSSNAQLSDTNNNTCVCKPGYTQSQQNPLQCIINPTCDPSCSSCTAGQCGCAGDTKLAADGLSCVCKQDGYNLKVIQGQISCEKGSNIDGCLANATFDTSSNKCVCIQGFYSINPVPLDCIPAPVCSYFQCKSCQLNTSTCIECPANSTLNTQLNKCECNQGFQIQSLNPLQCNLITPCDPNCEQCLPNSNKCVQCAQGYTLLVDGKTCRKSKCHYSCYCEDDGSSCHTANVCVRCRQPDFAHLVGNDFCSCNTPDYRLKQNSTWECEAPLLPLLSTECKWILFNKINLMVFTSDCSIAVENNQNYVVDDMKLDWQRAGLNLAQNQQCAKSLTWDVQYSQDCNTYQNLDAKYTNMVSDDLNNSIIKLKIPLIDVFQLTSVSTVQDRNILQILCIQIRLYVDNVLLRTHKFQIRVYTNRDQVQVFHLSITPQITDGCDKGQECVVVANLDVKGLICLNEQCNGFYQDNIVPSYVVGSHMYVRVQFADPHYTKYLSVVAVKFIDDTQIYQYQKGTQYWILRQELGYVDVDILLFQPHINVYVSISLKINLQKDAVRMLQSQSKETSKGDTVTQIYKIQIFNQKKTSNSEKQNEKSGAQILKAFAFVVIGFILAF